MRPGCTIYSAMCTPPSQKPRNYLRVAWQSALAAGLCLGLPAGLLFWLILLRESNHSIFVTRVVNFLQDYGLSNIILLILCSLLWSFLLSRISRYHAWWKIGIATALGIITAWFSPLSNLDGILYEVRPDLPAYLNYTAFMIGLIGGVTFFVGLAYGLILRSVKAALVIGLTTSFVSLLALLPTIFVFDLFGVRVGTGNLAMIKVTALTLLTSAMLGGMALGVGFTRFVGRELASR